MNVHKDVHWSGVVFVTALYGMKRLIHSYALQ